MEITTYKQLTELLSPVDANYQPISTTFPSQCGARYLSRLERLGIYTPQQLAIVLAHHMKMAGVSQLIFSDRTSFVRCVVLKEIAFKWPSSVNPNTSGTICFYVITRKDLVRLYNYNPKTNGKQATKRGVHRPRKG